MKKYYKIRNIALKYIKEFVFEKQKKIYYFQNNLYKTDKQIIVDEILKRLFSNILFFDFVFLKIKTIKNKEYLVDFLINDFLKNYDKRYLFRIKEVILKNGEKIKIENKKDIENLFFILKEIKNKECNKNFSKEIIKLYNFLLECQTYKKDDLYLGIFYYFNYKNILKKEVIEILPLKDLKLKQLENKMGFFYKYKIGSKKEIERWISKKKKGVLKNEKRKYNKDKTTK